MLKKLHPSEQNLIADIFKSKWSPDATLQVKVRKVLIFHDIDQAKSWDQE